MQVLCGLRKEKNTPVENIYIVYYTDTREHLQKYKAHYTGGDAFSTPGTSCWPGGSAYGRVLEVWEELRVLSVLPLSGDWERLLASWRCGRKSRASEERAARLLRR